MPELDRLTLVAPDAPGLDDRRSPRMRYAAKGTNRRWTFEVRRLLIASSTGLCLVSCASDPAPPRETMTVVTRNSPTTFYEDRDGRPAGLEYDLVTEFADEIGVEIEWLVLDGIGEILDEVAASRVDFAAAGLTKTSARSEAFFTGPEYQEIEEQVVCHRRARVLHVDDLVGKRVRVIADSSYQETLAVLSETHEELSWSTTADESTEELLQLVAERDLDCTVADSNIVSLDRRVLPDLRTPFAVGDTEYLAWFVSDSGEDLLGPMETWFEQMRNTGRLQGLLDRYYWHATTFDYYDTSVFFRRVEKRLPIFEQMFLEAEAVSGLDWRLLAAVGYQESHWDPEAVSRTGVRGLMMLTEATASDLGVDRLDPGQSILGGGKYLASLIRRIPAFVPEPDRTLLALAAYNIGFSHLEDARKLAIELGEDPNTWAGVRSVLPKLSQPKFYTQLRHGYARGNETVMFVQQTRNYHDLLVETFSRVREDTLPSGVLASTALLPSAGAQPD